MNSVYSHRLYIVILLILLSRANYAQEKIELKNANELTGKVINGQNVREANGNVEFVQGNVRVFCNSATQYIDANRVELRGSVRIYQDTLSLFTDRATYFGNDKRAVCEGGVTLKDQNATLRANNGVYSFNDTKAVFNGDVIIVNPEYRITSDELIYFRSNEDSFAKGDVIVTTDSAVIQADNIDFFKRQGKTFAYGSVRIESDSTIITSDTATNYSNEKKSFAAGNVKVSSLNNNSVIYGNIIENLERENYTIVKNNARLIQVDDNRDTLFIYSNIMEAFRNRPEYYVARENVEIIRDKFYSRCGLGIYFKGEETVSLAKEPVVWQENIQMSGDSIYADLPNSNLQTIYIKKEPSSTNSKTSFVISENTDEYFKDRYDQISGGDITLRFDTDKIKIIEVTKASRSIYFVYENGKANGLNSVEGDQIFIYFDEDEKVSRIKVNINPKGQFVPETLLNTVGLTLPGFELREDKPERK